MWFFFSMAVNVFSRKNSVEVESLHVLGHGLYYPLSVYMSMHTASIVVKFRNLHMNKDLPQVYQGVREFPGSRGFREFLGSQVRLEFLRSLELLADPAGIAVKKIYSQLPITRTSKGNWNRFELSGVENKWPEKGKKRCLLCISIYIVYKFNQI